MKKTIKLKKNYEYNNVFKKGKYCKGELVECFFITKENKKINSIGIAISSKIFTAVKRNKIKRIITEVYRKSEDNIKTGNIIIFLWRKKADLEKCTFENVYKDMMNIFKKIGILNE